MKATYCYDKADRLISTTDPAFSAAISYDSHGNTTKLGGSTMVYDVADRHLKTTAPNGEVVTYVRDALDRIVSRTAGGQTVRYSYSTGSDSPEQVLAPGTDNRALDKTIVLLGGAMKNINFVPATSTTPEKWTERYSYPNIHGDVIAIADSAGTKQGSTRHYDPYGTPLNAAVDNLTGKFDYGWLGSHQRGTETQGGLNVIEMGARQYVPALGRFLEVDPVEGGSANDYDYVDGDPINAFDLDGTTNWRRVFKTAVVVLAIAGALACGASLVCGVAVGIAAGAGSYAAANAGTASYSHRGLARSAALGGASGALGPVAARLKPGGFTWGASRYKHGGGGFNVSRHGVRRFGLDRHSFKLNGVTKSRWHFHAGKTKSQMKKHRPYQGGWRQ